MQQHSLALYLSAGVAIAACIAAIIYWLYRKWRIRNPPPKPVDPKPEGDPKQ